MTLRKQVTIRKLMFCFSRAGNSRGVACVQLCWVSGLPLCSVFTPLVHCFTFVPLAVVGGLYLTMVIIILVYQKCKPCHFDMHHIPKGVTRACSTAAGCIDSVDKK